MMALIILNIAYCFLIVLFLEPHNIFTSHPCKPHSSLQTHPLLIETIPIVNSPISTIPSRLKHLPVEWGLGEHNLIILDG